jgi:hypothetical protein
MPYSSKVFFFPGARVQLREHPSQGPNLLICTVRISPDRVFLATLDALQHLDGVLVQSSMPDRQFMLMYLAETSRNCKMCLFSTIKTTGNKRGTTSAGG